MSATALTVLALAALCEVGGDALIRKGLEIHRVSLQLVGFIVLGSYGILITRLPWDFSKLLGLYVVFFATNAVLVGWLIFRDRASIATFIGLGFIVAGGIIMQRDSH